MKNKRPPLQTRALAAKLRDNSGEIANHLNEALSTGDLEPVLSALEDAVRAQGIRKFTEKSGINRTNLHRWFRGDSNPSFKAMFSALTALDVRFVVRPLKEPNGKDAAN